ncbi:MAG: NAD-binding protein, partial [Halomonas sp.]
IALFAALIGKATVSINAAWQKRVNGMGNYETLVGHTLVIGWHGETTEQILDILKADTDLPDEVVLCVVKDMTNPRPGDLKFVRGESFSNADVLKRAGIAGASRIIIYDQSDERVATVALSAYSLKAPDAHIVAHCDNPHTAAMLRRTLPGIETTEALSIEMLVRSATDAGISRVVNELLAVNHGATQYQTRLSGVPAGTTYGDLFFNAKRAFNVTVLGVSDHGNAGDVLNPPMDRRVKDGDVMFYMADTRLTQTQISALFGTVEFGIVDEGVATA